MNSNNTTTVKQKRAGFMGFVLRHKMSTFLLILLLGVFIRAYYTTEKLQEQNQTLIETYETEIDSIRMTEMQTNARYFSWVMRSELLRKNYDDAQLYIDKLLTEPHIQSIYVIDTETNRILISSDTTEIGQALMDLSVLQTEEGTQRLDQDLFRFITPIAGFNKQIGVLVLQVKMSK